MPDLFREAKNFDPKGLLHLQNYKVFHDFHECLYVLQLQRALQSIKTSSFIEQVHYRFALKHLYP